MRKLDYMSTDPTTHPPLPRDMEYAWGCFPAISACFCAFVAMIFPIAAIAIDGIGHPTYGDVVFFITVALAWMFAVIALCRPSGLLPGIVAGFFALLPTLALLAMLFHLF